MPLIRVFFVIIPLIFVLSSAYATECSPNAKCSHALAMWGEPKYGKDFTHFEYTNPNAPKGGHVKYAAIGTFDSLNSHILKGVTAAGIGMIYDTLITSSDDEPFTKYGLIAKTIELPNDRGSVTFHLNEKAQWHDGTSITADDVVFSFNTLVSKGHPYYRSYYREIEKVEKLDKLKVKFTFTNNKNRELPLILGQVPILPKAYYDKHDFTKTSLEPPMGSGPYKIKDLDPGKWIRYKRVDDYWAKDLPVNKGRYNFDEITYDYYRDATIAVEAFKAGEYDLREENISKVWNNAYDIEAVKDGRIIKEEIKHERPSGMQAFVFNLRKEKFNNRILRKALSYAFDFEWTNKNLFNGAYHRTTSYYSNSEFASTGLPRGEELSILEPSRKKLPKSVFKEIFSVPKTDGSGNNRKNLLIARDLLKEAGWEIKEGLLVNQKTGKNLEIEFLINSPSFERVIGPIIKNLKKLGIIATMRTVDSAQYIKRVEEFDFDIVVNVFPQSLSPGNEQEDYWHSSRADINGTRNIIGIKNEVVDELVEKIITATNKKTLRSATRALDRVLLNNYYVIPNWHLDFFRVIYWNRFSRPKIRQKYLLGLDTWWVDKEKEKKLEIEKNS